jgi:hypothetical protein
MQLHLPSWIILEMNVGGEAKYAVDNFHDWAIG